jgi:hypothetical protein
MPLMDDDRPEVEAFVRGFAMAWRGLDEAANGKKALKNEKETFEEVLALAREIYGEPYDPPPASKKKPKVGMKEPWDV